MIFQANHRDHKDHTVKQRIFLIFVVSVVFVVEEPRILKTFVLNSKDCMKG